MIFNSPLEYLIAFAITFLFGALWTLCFGVYASKIRRGTVAHA